MKFEDMNNAQIEEVNRMIRNGRANELDPKLLNDREFLFYYDGAFDVDTLLQYVTDKELFKDKDFIVQYVIRTGRPDYIFRFVDEPLKSDRLFLIELMQRVHDNWENEQSIQLFSGILPNVNPDFKKDREFVYNAVRIFPSDFQNACPELRNEKAFVLELLELMDKEFGWPEDYYDKETIYKYRGETLIDDRDIFIAAVTSEECPPLSYYDDKEQTYLSSELSKDRSCILEAIKSDHKWFKYADDEFKKDKDFIMQCMLINPYIYECLSEEQLEDHDIDNCRLRGLLRLTQGQSLEDLKRFEEFLDENIADLSKEISESRIALLKRIITKQNIVKKQEMELKQLKAISLQQD